MPSWELTSDTGVLDINYDVKSGMKIFNQTLFSTMHVDRMAEPITSGSAVIDQQTTSNETRLTLGDAESTISGFGGLYLARTTSDDTLNIRGISDFDDEKNNLGIYAEMRYRLTDQWALTGGMRYQRDQIERSGTSSYATDPLDYDKTFEAFLPKLTIAYDVTDSTTVGAMVSRGYNPGGVNLSFAGKKYITFDAETAWNYELFSRSSFMNNCLILTGNLFYSDYKDSQRLLPDYLAGMQYGSVVVNADSAESYGLELWLDYLMRSDLRIRAGAGLLHTDIGRFTNTAGTDYEGNEFGGAPAYMMSIGADWDIIPKVRLTGEVRHTDGYSSTDENASAYAVDSYTVANFRITYAPGSMEFYVYANNIFDNRVPTSLADDRSVGGIVANMLEPRTIGVGIRHNF